MPYEIRPLSEEEADEILEKLGEYLKSEVPSDPGTPEEEQLVFVIRDGEGKIIAGSIVNIHEWGRAVLANLWTDKRFRRQGLASMLIREAERAVREKGCHIMCLGTMDFMARPLYEKHGYKVFSVTKDYPKEHEGWSLMKRLDTGIPDYVPSNNSGAFLYKVERGTEEDAEIIGNGLGDYNTGFAEDEHDDIPLGKKLVDQDGKLIAGIFGEVDSWNGCDIDCLWVEEPYRGRGLGTFLLREIEREARENGAFIMFADAGDWNAGFFRKNGFSVKGELEDYPRGHCAYELEKRLDKQEQEKPIGGMKADKRYGSKEDYFMDQKTMMEKLAREAYRKGSFNGTWLYAEHGKIVSKGACGFRDAENKLPMQEDTIFEMASITKMFTATAVMLLAREGRLDLDDEYVKYFPDYPYPGVKIRHLLTHTSGMPDDFETDTWVCPVWEKEKRIPPCSEILRFIRESGEEASHAPGETFRYTDIGYCLLANLVEKLSGTRFEEFLRKNIFEPSGMKDSGIYHTRRDGRPSDRFARNMVLENDGSYVPSDVSKLTAPYVIGSDGLNGCDYLYTTISDMLAWDRALREEKVLSREEQRIMYTPVKLNSGEEYDDGDGEGYGFGWGIVNDGEHGLIVSHSGGMPGLETWFEHFVDEDRTLVILNCREYKDVRAFVGFWEGMRAIAGGGEAEPVLSIEDIAVKDPDKSMWESFCGKYEHPEESDFIVDEVYMKDGDLYANAIDGEGDSLTFHLYPIGENEFGRKRGMLKLKFGDGCLMFDDLTCKKLQHRTE